MIYSLLVLSSPTSGQTSRNAAQFATAVIARGHNIHRVFFFDEGTLNGSANSIVPQGEADPIIPWLELADKHGVELAICISSALKHGMLDSTEANRHERPYPTIDSRFIVSGLGQLIDACTRSDRLMTFGG